MPVTRGKDVQGPFYRWGSHGKKYRYTAGNASERNAAKARANRQGRAISANVRKGRERASVSGGLLEFALPVVNLLLPNVREKAPPLVRDWIKRKGSLKIVNVTVVRNPLTSKFKTILNWITLGDFKQKIKKENYDDVFHLFMILRFQDGSALRVDKNHVVQISTNIEKVTEKGGEQKVAGNPGCSLEEFFARGERVAGSPRAMWVYSPVSPRWNCQAFVSWCLKGSGLLSPELDRFVNQNAEKLVEGGLARRFLGSLTNLAGRFDVLFHGKGIRV